MDDSLETLRQKLSQIITDSQPDLEKALNGTKAAGTRVRKTMQEVKTIAQQIRQKVLEVRETQD